MRTHVETKKDRWSLITFGCHNKPSLFLTQGAYIISREIKGLGYLVKTGNSCNNEELTVVRYENAK